MITKMVLENGHFFGLAEPLTTESTYLEHATMMDLLILCYLIESLIGLSQF